MTKSRSHLWGVGCCFLVAAVLAVIWARSHRQQPTATPAAIPAQIAAGADDIETPWGPEFEIDADADRYSGRLPLTVAFSARPLNGTPPYAFTWDFGDGSPSEAGERVSHIYNRLGRVSAFAIGRDATGQTWKVQLVLLVVPAEDYSRRKAEPNADAPT